MKLRAARPLDAGAVGAILSEFTQQTDWLPRIHTEAQDLSHAGTLIDRGWVTLAEQNGKVTGFLARNGAMIHSLYVAGDKRGQGAGSRLLDHAKQDCPVLELWTFQANRPARAFYARHGFAEVEQTDGAGNDEKLPDVRLVWERAADD